MQTLMIDMSVLVVGHQSMRNADCLVLDTNYCWLVRGLVKLNRELNIASNFILDSFSHGMWVLFKRLITLGVRGDIDFGKA